MFVLCTLFLEAWREIFPVFSDSLLSKSHHFLQMSGNRVSCSIITIIAMTYYRNFEFLREPKQTLVFACKLHEILLKENKL